MTHSSTIAILTGFLCLCVAAQTVAQGKKMYSWTDENGTVHFSETQPPGQQVNEQVMPEQDSNPASPSPYAQPEAGPSMAEQRRAEIAEKNQQAKANKAMNSAQCGAWQAEVERLEPNRRVFYTNDQGETERMDDVERVDRVAQLKNQIARNCK